MCYRGLWLPLTTGEEEGKKKKGGPVQAMVKQHQLQSTVKWVLAQKEVGCMRVAVHVSMDEDHLIEGARHQLSHFLRLETQLLNSGPAGRTVKAELG